MGVLDHGILGRHLRRIVFVRRLAPGLFRAQQLNTQVILIQKRPAVLLGEVPVRWRIRSDHDVRDAALPNEEDGNFATS